MRMTRWLLTIVWLLATAGAPAAVVEIDAGPIWNNIDAGNKCPGLCSARGAIKWTGDWRTTMMGRMSVCSCDFAGPGPGRPSPAASLAAANACSVGGTNKCPGCAVSCESGLRPACTPPIDGFATGFCQRDASCRCM